MTVRELVHADTAGDQAPEEVILLQGWSSMTKERRVCRAAFYEDWIAALAFRDWLRMGMVVTVDRYRLAESAGRFKFTDGQ